MLRAIALCLLLTGCYLPAGLIGLPLELGIEAGKNAKEKRQ